MQGQDQGVMHDVQAPQPGIRTSCRCRRSASASERCSFLAADSKPGGEASRAAVAVGAADAFVRSTSSWAAEGGSSCRRGRAGVRNGGACGIRHHVRAPAVSLDARRRGRQHHIGNLPANVSRTTPKSGTTPRPVPSGPHAPQIPNPRRPSTRAHMPPLTFRNQRTPTSASSASQATFFFFSLRGWGSGEGTRRAAAAARSFAVDMTGPRLDSGALSMPPLPPPPSTVTPLPRPPRPPRAAKGLALTLDTSVRAAPAVPPPLPPASTCFDAGAPSAGFTPRVGSTVSVLMVTVCRWRRGGPRELGSDM